MKASSISKESVTAIEDRLKIVEATRKNLTKKSDFYRGLFQTNQAALSAVYNQLIAEEILLTVERDTILELLKNEKY
jgi:hypothetical protein